MEKKALKLKTEAEKAIAKQEKEAEKEKKAEEKRLAKEEKRKSKGAFNATPVDAATTAHEDTASHDLTAVEPKSEPDITSPISPASPKSDSKGIKSLLNKLKRRSKGPASPTSTEADKQGFIGGVALRNSESRSQSRRNSNPASPGSGTAALAPQHNSPGRRYSDVSSLSSASATSLRGRSPKRTAKATTEGSDSPGLASPTSEYEEARDTFNESLAPPPTFLTDVSTARKGSPNRDSKFIEAL